MRSRSCASNSRARAQNPSRNVSAPDALHDQTSVECHPCEVSTSTILLLLGAFLASAVEMVEALTIVLGVGVVRGWRSPLIGAAAAR